MQGALSHFQINKSFSTKSSRLGKMQLSEQLQIVSLFREIILSIRYVTQTIYV